MPNFLIVGAPKSGTSSLYNYLNQHPQVAMSRVKEPHFFTFENKEIDFQGTGDLHRLRKVVTRLEDYEKLFEGVSNEVAIGEASTTYLESAYACDRIKHHIPEAKLIAILRNPVETAYASFLHLVRDGDETITDFGLALKEEEKRIQQNWGKLWHYKHRGFYYVQVKQYFDNFHPEQLKIYRYEDFKNDPNKVLKDIFQFLGVDDTFTADMSARYNVSGMPKNPLINRLILKSNPLKTAIKLVVPETSRRRLSQKIKDWNFNNFQRKPEMKLEVRQQLVEDYQEDILKLQDLIQQDLSNWLK
ncbi:MAG: sulfotransferase family protein [Halothece sp.]